MQSGRMGQGTFRNTPYYCGYVNYRNEGRVAIALKRTSTTFIQESFPLLTGSLHSSSIGVADRLVDIDPNGGTLSWQGIYNRAVMLNQKNRAIAEARVKAANKSLDLAETLVDLDSTFFLIAEKTLDVLLAYKAARKGDFNQALAHLGLVAPPKGRPGWQLYRKPRQKHFAKDVANFWLEIQYGWLPLLSDIANAVELIKSMIYGREEHFTVVRRIETGLVIDRASTNTTRFPTHESDNRVRTSVEVRFRFRVNDAFAAFLNSLSILNPAYVLWVSLPMSFVVDWFLPIGTMLEALTGHIGLQFTSGYATTRSWGWQLVTATSANPLIGYPKVAESGRAYAYAERAYMLREPFLSWPGFLPYIRFPFSSDQRVASAIALITTSRR